MKAMLKGSCNRKSPLHIGAGTYVFDKVGPDWVLNGNTPLMGVGKFATGDNCGREVAISANGTKVISAYTGGGHDESYAIVYQVNGSGAWSQLGGIILKYPYLYGFASYEYSVAMADQVGEKNAATMVAVGSRATPQFLSEPIGSAAVYKLESICSCVELIAEMRMDIMNMMKFPFSANGSTKGKAPLVARLDFSRNTAQIAVEHVQTTDAQIL